MRSVRTLTITADTAGGAQEYAGEVRARVESRLAFRVGGKMIARPVDLGDSVKAGQVLAQLDPQDLRLGQDAARATVQAARVNLVLAAADFKRFKELRDQGFISSAELERRETSLKAAKAQFEQSRAQAGVQNNQARYSTLVADTAGVVTAVEAESGAVLASGATVLRLAHDGPRDVVFAVPEDRLETRRALEGQPGALKVKLWGDGQSLLAATVREVAAAADAATRTYVIKADLGRATVKLGQTASVLVERPPVATVVKLPLAAVMEQQGKTAVWLLDTATMTVRAQPIQVAGADGNSVIVAAGLAPGQVIVSAGVHVLSPGQKVALYSPTRVAASASLPAASAAQPR